MNDPTFPVPTGYRILDAMALPNAIAALPDAASRLGGTPKDWSVTEVSDGNMNAVFRLDGPQASLIAKQALPYIRAVGEGWPFPVSRVEYERLALVEAGRITPESVPAVIAYDESLALLVTEALAPHIIARRGFVAGRTYPHLAEHMGDYLARTLFFTSDFHLSTPDKKALAARFAGNAILCATTEDVIFTGPYYNAPLNRVTPGLEPVAARLRADPNLKTAATAMKHAFRTKSEALIHGDLHTGSLMLTETDTRVIDAEWAFHGPMGFDPGAVIGNLLLAHASQPGHAAERGEAREAYGDWILETIEALWTRFAQGFHALAREGARELLHPAVFDAPMVEAFVEERLAAVFADAMGFAGAKMIRRILGISHVEDLEAIANEGQRARCEAKALAVARRLLIERERLHDIRAATEVARQTPPIPF